MRCTVFHQEFHSKNPHLIHCLRLNAIWTLGVCIFVLYFTASLVVILSAAYNILWWSNPNVWGDRNMHMFVYFHHYFPKHICTTRSNKFNEWKILRFAYERYKIAENIFYAIPWRCHEIRDNNCASTNPLCGLSNISIFVVEICILPYFYVCFHYLMRSETPCRVRVIGNMSFSVMFSEIPNIFWGRRNESSKAIPNTGSPLRACTNIETLFKQFSLLFRRDYIIQYDMIFI